MRQMKLYLKPYGTLDFKIGKDLYFFYKLIFFVSFLFRKVDYAARSPIFQPRQRRDAHNIIEGDFSRKFTISI